MPRPPAVFRASAAAKARATRLLTALQEHYPDAHCELTYSNPHELLVATILSAQTTDAGVNRVTPALFARFRSPADYAHATPSDIEPFIHSIGLFRTKAKSVHAAMTTVHERFGGLVPATMEDLLTLRGVARKTASVVLGNAFGLNEGFVVDTHVMRLSRRLGLVRGSPTPLVIEQHMIALFPRDSWCIVSHMLIWHGRRACTARGRGCSNHPICREFGRCCERRKQPPGGI